MAMKLVDAEQLEADLTSVADKIRAKTGGADALAFPSGFVSAVEGIESADSALAEVEYALSNGYTDYSSYFQGLDQMTEVPTEILKHTNTGYDFSLMFSGCTNAIIPTFDISHGQKFRQMFYNCHALVTLPEMDTAFGNDFYTMFSNCQFLVTIPKINISRALYVDAMFYNCFELENITFEGFIKITGLDLSPCSKLTHDSLMSAINALYDWASEGSTSTYTLKLGSTNLAKLTDAEKAIATQRGWTLA